uniref:Phospho-N-acetylmuramoyl-pentapeptide-transferase n=2 Tax=Oryza punctata TaxID=4537 RepID=A0A0E0JFG7_ORYPU
MASPPSAHSSSSSAAAAYPAPHRPRLRSRRSLRPPPQPRVLPSSTACRPSALRDFQFRNIFTRPTSRRGVLPVASAFDEDLGDFSLVHADGDGPLEVVVYSSESEWSDEEVILNPMSDVELPLKSKSRFEGVEGAMTVAAHRTQQGLMNNVGLIAFLAILLLFVDWCSWRIVRLPLDSFYLTRPFLISSVLSALAGFLFAPVADNMKIHHFRRRGKLKSPSYRKPTPAMGGLFFVPIGIFVARRQVGSNSTGVNGAAIITLIFAMVGLLDDISNLVTDRNRKIPNWMKLFIQIVAGIYLSIWLSSTNISTPYNTKFLVPLPPPLGLAFIGKIYLVLAAICSLSMGTGVTLVDRLDGLAGGVAALALAGLSVASLPICSEMSVFGASMSGACTGFLFHNRYRASIVMGCVGSFALGGAIGTIAACSGMFIPMFIACSIFLLELLLVIFQVPFRMTKKHFLGTNRYPLRILPSYYFLKSWGIKEPYIVAGAYIVSCLLTAFAGYLGLVSAMAQFSGLDAFYAEKHLAPKIASRERLKTL